METAYTISPLGDSALLVDFGNIIDEAINRKVLQLFQRLKDASPAFTDVIPAYSSVALYYDVLALSTSHQTAFDAAKAIVMPFLQEEKSVSEYSSCHIKIPVCYANNFAPDLEEIAFQKGLSSEQIIQLHTAKSYRVYMIGFLPGFAYMGTVDERLATPRRAQPRKNIPPGSVGIAGKQTGIYPLASPGGWNIIGRTPLKLFDSERENPVLLQPGDEISFYSITEDEFADYQGRHI